MVGTARCYKQADSTPPLKRPRLCLESATLEQTTPYNTGHSSLAYANQLCVSACWLNVLRRCKLAAKEGSPTACLYTKDKNSEDKPEVKTKDKKPGLGAPVMMPDGVDFSFSFLFIQNNCLKKTSPALHACTAQLSSAMQGGYSCLGQLTCFSSCAVLLFAARELQSRAVRGSGKPVKGCQCISSSASSANA